MRCGSPWTPTSQATPVAAEELVALGRRNAHDVNEPFNMAYMAARTCGIKNGVSRLHGEVSQGIFQELYPRWPEHEVPVSYVTNGVHVPSWADEIWTNACGKDRWLGATNLYNILTKRLNW